VFVAARVPVSRNFLRVSIRSSAEHALDARSSDQLEPLVWILFRRLEQFSCKYDAPEKKYWILHCVQHDGKNNAPHPRGDGSSGDV
jgi:hypothetical protein